MAMAANIRARRVGPMRRGLRGHVRVMCASQMESFVATGSGNPMRGADDSGVDAGRTTTTTTTTPPSPVPMAARGSGAVGEYADEGTAGDEAALAAASSSRVHLFRGLYRFCRPHTVAGTAISITSVSFMAFLHAGVPLSLVFSRWCHASVAALLANVAIVGYNQLCDISIDAVNKPYLPLVNGDLGTRAARLLVAGTAVAAIVVSRSSMSLRVAVVGSLLLGWMYSSPAVRLKRSPVLAALCILLVRAVVVQLCFFTHAAGGVGVAMPHALLVSTVFMAAFSVAIALGKDMPDVDGDEGAGIRTASVRTGIPRCAHTHIHDITTPTTRGELLASSTRLLMDVRVLVVAF